jgi:hypothetical protein
MSKKVCASMFVVMLVLVAGTVAAQTTSTEIRQGKVLAVYGNHLVVKTDTGETKEFEVPEGFEFNHDGRMVGIGDLKPGMILTAAITTTTTPTVVKTEEIKKGTVMAVAGRSAIIRNDETGETKKYNNIPGDFVFYSSNGAPKTIYDIKKGEKVTATIVHQTSEIATETDMAVMAADAPKAAPAPAPAPQPATTSTYSSASTLPKTGSLLPLAGLVGLVALFAGLGLSVIRRF